MKIDLFIQLGEEWWNNYLKRIQSLQRNGLVEPRDSKLLYPSIMLATSCKSYYILELIGANREFHQLRTMRKKELSVYRYLNQFDAEEPDPFFIVNSMNNHFRGLSLARYFDYEAALTRFPHLKLYPTMIQSSYGKGSVFTFGKDFRSLSLEHCTIINSRNHLVRCKAILWASVVSSEITKKELIGLFDNSTGDSLAHAVYTVKDDEEKLHVAGQLQSMFLSPGLYETTIGEFIKSHPEIIKMAFGAARFEYEPFLKWMEHDGTVEDYAINPDLMVQRHDGFYDIYDLKTALLNRLSITRAERRRRRFIDYVEEGISQLANYREYFTYSKNAEHAKMKYGIEVNNPKLVLVVGSYENSYPDQISQACRKYNNVEVIDYDTLCQMYVGTQTNFIGP
jgi:hypothetical protein